MADALKVNGRNGRFSLINRSYEPMGTSHHDRPVWVARDVQPIYIFHTGKSRWVISKRLDDGSKCYAYIEDTGKDPTKASGQWVMIDNDDQWRPDANVSCVATPSSTDTFVQLRMSMESEMTQYGFNDMSKLRTLWKRLDFNGNNVVSLAEIDKMVVELVAGGTWPAWLNNKPALMRAYKKTILVDGDGDDWVEKREFHNLLLNIFWFNKLWQIFEQVDTGADRRMDVREFQGGLSKLGLSMSDHEAQQEFAKIDSNHGGQVLFVEFCAWVRMRVSPDAHSNFDGDIVSGEHCGRALRHHHGHKATQHHFVSKKSFSDFDALEKKVKAIIADHKKLHSLWRELDFNGNGIVSLAEIDKLVVQNSLFVKYPILNHKPALMRAYKKTISKAGGGDGDDWVQKREFKQLLANLFYFNKLFWIFEHEDGDKDRRMTFQEFKRCMSICGVNMSEAEAKSDFSKVDKNHGGIVLFDEFCAYFASKSCPQALTSMVE
mmetsp:Transcript_74354/g.131485  ORF Transcript_74354/g.131485 Transcript_74354/m.131485 type:complete len:490 (-) Transcript_74354:109-1578(-)